ncbi:hypothetical protein [Methylobacterium sp. J-067]|uniref:hypothetical protein n=1 Tax=Methylobacterium sp. J-067 TaxID=2836648 RepID=UPI001FB8F3EF|nr:hypothetical protein [Methylobacterium sp. J-067]MCJ2024679.1 hypothetical protein [Methylobacterium sp. J-067]
MPEFGFTTARKARASGLGAVKTRLSGLGKAMADFVDSIVRGLGPPPVLQPIPVRVRDPRRVRN